MQKPDAPKTEKEQRELILKMLDEAREGVASGKLNAIMLAYGNDHMLWSDGDEKVLIDLLCEIIKPMQKIMKAIGLKVQL